MKFIEKLNYRLIIFHLLATIFLLLGAKRFSLLYDLDFIEAYYNYGSTEYLHHLNDTTGGTIGERIAYLLYATAFSTLIALIISFIISLTISLRTRIFLVNSFFVLIIGFLINRFGLLDVAFIKTVTNAIGNLFISYGLKYVIIINGGLLTTIGIVVYFNKWTKKFIGKPYEQNHNR